LLELSAELAVDERGKGAGRDFVRAALGAAPVAEVVVAAVAPGNAASLRCFLAAGFVVLGSSQLLRPGRTA
jgi:L-amino acid N-acyltransferase YncA